MIVSIIYDILISLADMVVRILPNWHLESNQTATEAMSYFTQIMIGMNEYLPVKTLFICIVSYYTFELAIIIGNLFFGFIALLRGSGKPEIS